LFLFSKIRKLKKSNNDNSNTSIIFIEEDEDRSGRSRKLVERKYRIV